MRSEHGQNESPSASMQERFKSFTNFVNNEPLIEPRPTLEGVSSEVLEKNPNGSIYYGTGLTTPRAMGVGLPFDVMGMILVAERIRRILGLKAIYHHIADTHAKTNEWIDSKEVDARAKAVRSVLERVTKNLGLDAFNVVLSSEFDQLSEYQNMVAAFRTKSAEHEYVIREMADMEWYRTHHDVTMKMGWIVQGSEVALGFDERLFDREYRKIKGPQLSFVYTKPGRTFDRSRPKASPYIQIAGESRLLLKKGENVGAKMSEAIEKGGDSHLFGARKHLEAIVRIYEKLYGSLGKIPLEDKLQTIIDRATK